MGKLANPQKFINFVHWSGGCGMNEITARLLTLRIAQFFLIMMRALRAFGFRYKFKKNCASAGNVSIQAKNLREMTINMNFKDNNCSVNRINQILLQRDMIIRMTT